MQRKVILVLGMHRSGTSALARTLSLLGCDLPHTLVPETSTNPTGHWEPNTLMAFNNEILQSAGSSWDDWLEFNPDWYCSPVCESFLEQAPGILRAEYDVSPLFVLKDPRNCRLTRFWFDVFDRERIEPLVALPLRNPLEVVASLQARDGMHRDHAMLLWLRHVLDAEQGSRGRRRVFVTYDELLNDWAGLADRMQSAFGIAWPKAIAHAGRDVDGFLDAGNRHHVRSMHTMLVDPTISQWVRDADRILIKWVQEGEDSNDHAALDEIRDQLNVAGPTFARLTRDISDERHRNADLQARIATYESDLLRAREELSALRETHVQHVADAEQCKAKLTDELAQQRAQGAALADALAQEQDAKTALSQALAQRDEAQAKLAQDLEQSRADAAAQREAYEQAAEAIRSATADKIAAEAIFSAERDHLRRQLAQGAASCDQLEREKADLARKLRATEQALGQAKAALADRQHDLANSQSMLRQREEEIHQTLATLEQARQATAASEQRLKVVQAKLKSADEWVFRLAGDRKLAEEQTAVAGRRLAATEKALASLTARAGDLERQRLLDQQELGRLQLEMAGMVEHQADLLAQAQAETQRLRLAQAQAVTQVEALTQSLAGKDAEMATARSRLTQAQARLAQHQAKAEKLAARLGQMEIKADRTAKQAQWLQQVHAVVTSYPRWWTLLPAGVQGKWRYRRLRRLFDAEAYLNRYPDVLSSGMDPLRHYILHGMAENRTL